MDRSIHFTHEFVFPVPENAAEMLHLPLAHVLFPIPWLIRLEGEGIGMVPSCLTTRHAFSSLPLSKKSCKYRGKTFPWKSSLTTARESARYEGKYLRNREISLGVRAKQVSPFKVMEILERARGHEAAGRDIVHMEIGEPDFPTPPAIVAAAQQHLAGGCPLGYTPAGGLPALRQAISMDYGERYGKAPDPRRIFLTPGASGALSLVLGLLVDAGDEVLLADPGYPCYPNFILLAGGIPRALPVDSETGFNLTPSQIAASWMASTRGILLASPSNPTGTVMPQTTFQQVIETVEERAGYVISDEIYHGLEYGERAVSALAFSDQAFVINSFSKYFGMTGWRLGWAVVPEWAVEAAERLSQNLFISAPTLSQHAALASFSKENRVELERRRLAFSERREVLLQGLTDLGFGLFARADGAFYVYADSSPFAANSEVFARELLDQAGVALTPGTDFGIHGAQSHVRFAYTASIPRIEEALDRIRHFLR